jgi:hypothetical protein
MVGGLVGIKLERIWKEVAIALNEVLTWHLPGRYEENHKKKTQS